MSNRVLRQTLWIDEMTSCVRRVPAMPLPSIRAVRFTRCPAGAVASVPAVARRAGSSLGIWSPPEAA